jgi:hypothetical protein
MMHLDVGRTCDRAAPADHERHAPAPGPGGANARTTPTERDCPICGAIVHTYTTPNGTWIEHHERPKPPSVRREWKPTLCPLGGRPLNYARAIAAHQAVRNAAAAKLTDLLAMPAPREPSKAAAARRVPPTADADVRAVLEQVPPATPHEKT